MDLSEIKLGCFDLLGAGVINMDVVEYELPTSHMYVREEFLVR